MVTPADWDRQHEIHLGATFNLAHTLRQMLHLRPRNRFEDLESVYLVGGGTHPGSGLPVIFESARITSRLIGQEFGDHRPDRRRGPAGRGRGAERSRAHSRWPDRLVYASVRHSEPSESDDKGDEACDADSEGRDGSA